MKTNNMSSRSRVRPQPVGGILDKLVASLGISRSYYGWQIVSQWPDIVGEYYARKSKAVKFAEGILYIAVEDASWRQMMAMDTEKILGIIRKYPHGRVIKQLRLVWGEKGQ